MTLRIFCATSIFLLQNVIGSSSSTLPLVPFRPPAVPLIVQSPYISVWSPADNAYDTSTAHWSGAASTLVGLLRVDSTPFVWLGPAKSIGGQPVTQVGHPTVAATTTTYAFLAGGVSLNVSFTSPLIPTNLTLLTQPATYLTFSLSSVDGKDHTAELYFDFDATLVTNNTYANTTLITWKRVDSSLSPGTAGMRVGAASQFPLDPITCGQSEPLTASQTIVWGWAYLLADSQGDGAASSAITSTISARSQFLSTGTIPSSDDPAPPKQVGDGFVGPVLAWSLGTVPASGEVSTRRATFFMDEILAASYYVNDSLWTGNPASAVLPHYWRKDLPFNDTVGVPAAALQAAHDGYNDAMAACATFDMSVFTSMESASDVNMATFASLVVRQVLAANLVAWHPVKQEMWVVFKEIASGGDFSTMDVVYPASPLLTILSPDLLAASLIPLMEASFNETIYRKAWVIHDIGKFPIADRPDGGQEDMPAEETSNLMLMTAAISMIRGGNVSWLEKYFENPGGFDRWSGFLYQSLPFLPRQGTTDDFLGSCANSTNLEWKAAAGLAAYGYLQYQRGNISAATDAWKFAGYSAALMTEYGWYSAAEQGKDADQTAQDHFVWGYGYDQTPNSSFLMYNGFYPRALRMYNLLPNQTAFVQAQADYYQQNQLGQFGIPLINGSTGAKGDWLSFYAASLYDVSEQEQEQEEGKGKPRSPPQPAPLSTSIFQALLAAANATNARTGMTDFFDSRTAAYGGKYRARPVLGGTFAPLVVVELAALPPMPHEEPMAAAFDAGHQQAMEERKTKRKMRG